MGGGGWPKIRYFNKATGYGGKGYKQKTGEDVCDELGKDENMQDYVLDMGGTSLCDVVYGTDCTEKELQFIIKHWDLGTSMVAAAKQEAERDLAAGSGKWQQAKKKILLLGNILSSEDIA